MFTQVSKVAAPLTWNLVDHPIGDDTSYEGFPKFAKAVLVLAYVGWLGSAQTTVSEASTSNQKISYAASGVPRASVLLVWEF
jgi:hypothetical protein